MTLNVVVALPHLIARVNTFSAAYQAGYTSVRVASDSFLKAPTPAAMNAAADLLAVLLRKVLIDWGAGVRGAPDMQSVAQMKSLLLTLRADLLTLSQWSLSDFRWQQGKPVVVKRPNAANVDVLLLSVLNRLGGLFITGGHPINVTYPMKAVLLLTGLMPALDSQVREGMRIAGMEGLGGTRHVLPTVAQIRTATARKILSLPYLLGECWATHPQLATAGQRCSFAMQNDPGRLFDILFFVQGRDSAQLGADLIRYDGSQDWY